MGTVSVSLPSDGQTIDAADYNTPINTIVTEINGSLDSNNIAEGGVVPNSLTDGTGTSWVWQDWTPTYSNITVGDGTVVAKYVQVGKTVHAFWKITCGATTSITNTNSISLPVTASSDYVAGMSYGQVYAIDTSTSAVYGGWAEVASTTTARSRWTLGGSEPQLTATFPLTEAVNDVYSFSLTYQAA